MADTNAEALARLRRRLLLAQIFFIASIVLMPLGCACPCGIGSFVGNSTVKTVFFVIAFILPLVGLAGTLLMGSDLARWRKYGAIVRAADALGLTYTEHPKEKSFAYLTNVQILSEGHTPSAEHLMEGECQEHEISIMNYTYLVGSGRYTMPVTQTVVALHEAVEGVPNLVLYPRSFWDKIVDAVRGRTMELPGEKAFNKNFALSGMRADEIIGRFSEDVIERCLEEPELSVEIQDGTMFAFRRNTALKASDYEPFLNQMIDLAAALREG